MYSPKDLVFLLFSELAIMLKIMLACSTQAMKIPAFLSHKIEQRVKFPRGTS